MLRVPNINQCVKNFLRLRKVKFIGLLSNGSRLTKTSFVFDLVSLDCGLLENCF